MNPMNLMIILFVAVTFYMFNDQFFLFTAEVDHMCISWAKRGAAFLITFAWFIVVTYMQLPLYINWLGFFAIEVLQVHYFFSYRYSIAGALSFFSLIIGLAINGLFRSIFAFLLKLPLNAFDNALPSLKQYPIATGFLVTGVFFFFMRRLKLQKKVGAMIHEPQSLSFFLKVEGCLFIFLELQLLMYSQNDNIIGNKLWGIKGAIFSLILLLIASIYALRVSALYKTMEKQHLAHKQLIEDKENMDNLWKLAYTDMLTGCNNSMLLKKRLKEYEGYGGKLTLGFIDLNGLKIVNDQYGHLEGDHYLKTVVTYLNIMFKDVKADIFRYGGDEFIILSSSLTARDMDALLLKLNEELSKIQYKYTMNISHGIAFGDSANSGQLLHEADQKMYQNKLKFYENKVG